jgi:HK97 family phage portal protein
VGLFNRSIRPPDDIVPNANDPASVPPSTVGPDQLVTPGDPDGVTVTGDDGPGWTPLRVTPSGWSGWPDDWWTPSWSGGGIGAPLSDTAWMCVDFNANQLSSMPPYLKNAASTLNADWLNNPNPDVYTGWEEFAKQLFWDYQAVGEAFVWATARYSTGWPSRFNVVPPWWVQVELIDGLRRYMIGSMDVTEDLLHVRYQSQVGYAHGVGPLEVGRYRMVAAQMLIRYGTKLAAGGGIPAGVLQHPEELSAEQASTLQAQWVQSRLSTIGEPAVLSGGLTWTPTQINPNDMALTALLDREEGRIAHLLGVPSELVGIPTGTDPMTYKNVTMWTDLHWRTGLRPKAQHVMSALSGWALPRGTWVELNRDEYVAAEPLERAQAYQILAAIIDPASGQPAITVQEIREAERLDNSTPSDIASGVLR